GYIALSSITKPSSIPSITPKPSTSYNSPTSQPPPSSSSKSNTLLSSLESALNTESSFDDSLNLQSLKEASKSIPPLDELTQFKSLDQENEKPKYTPPKPTSY